MAIHNNIPPSLFTSVLVSLNTLSDFLKWHFEKGMGFGESDKWWKGTGERTHPHEGVDICFYTTKKGIRDHLGLNTFIPPLYSGEVVKVFDDFIGKTILLRHAVSGKDDYRLYSMYGHVEPLLHVTAGQQVNYSEKIATIADSTIKKRPMLSHLHISTLWLPRSFPAETLTWGMENDACVRFCNPLEFIDGK